MSFQMNSSADSDSPSPNALGDLRSFRFCKKPTFVHNSVASGSSTGNVDESPSKYILSIIIISIIFPFQITWNLFPYVFKPNRYYYFVILIEGNLESNEKF